MVLQAGVNVVGIVQVHADGIDLADGLVEEVIGRPPAVVGDVHAAVASQDEPLRILFVPPHRAEVAEHAAEELAAPGLPAVLRLVHRIAVHDDLVRVRGVRLDLVERIRRLRASHIDLAAVRLPPGPAAILAPVHLVPDGSTLLTRAAAAAAACHRARVAARRYRLGARIQVFNDRRQHVGIPRTDVEPDPSNVARGQPRELPPRLPAVISAMDAAPWSSEYELPRRSML